MLVATQNAVGLARFRVAVLVARAVTMAVFVEQEETEYVRSKAAAADDQDQLRLRDHLRFEKSLNGVQKDVHAEGHQKDGVD